MRKSCFAALGGMLIFAGCAAGIQLARPQVSDPGALLFNGYAKAEVNCYICHNGDGTGSGRGPNLAPKVARLPDMALLEVIDKGEGFMPAFRARLSADEKQQIVIWLRSRFGGPQETAPTPIDLGVVDVEPSEEEEEPAPLQ
ncbi:MAG: cytochrome c [Myxococcota bacterium]